jgi:DNA-binding beta-propeller fold protein YncE
MKKYLMCILVIVLSNFSITVFAEFKVNPHWPKPLPNHWLFGQVSGAAVDAKDHVWILQRPGSLNKFDLGASQNPPISTCCHAAPPVMEFDTQGNFIQAWGGPGKGYRWPTREHSIFVDKKGFVWIDGGEGNEGQLLKFTSHGEFVLQIGLPGPTNSNDTKHLGSLAGITVDTKADEVYIADGYYNHRVIVFDATSGVYKRHWGAYGKRPLDYYKGQELPTLKRQFRALPPSKIPSSQFGNPVHCVRLSDDGLVYVCDRINDRIQIFQKDGTFIKEYIINPATAGSGSTWDLAFSTDKHQRYIYLADGMNNHIYTIERKNGKIIKILGRQGRYAGQFHWAHSIAIDSKNNLYVGEVDTGQRIQKFDSK